MASGVKRWLRTTTIALCFLGVCVVAVNINAIKHLRHAYYYRDAEKTVEQLREIYYPDYVLSADEVESQLRVHPVVGDLPRVPDNELLEGDLILFRVNRMYTVGLKKDGNVIWVVDGVR